MIFRTAGFQPAHDHEAGWKPAVRKIMNSRQKENGRALARPSLKS
jgi:hypothetical protein